MPTENRYPDEHEVVSLLSKLVVAVNGVAVSIDKLSLHLKRYKEVDNPAQVIRSFIDLTNALVALINTDANNLAAAQAARSDAEAKLAALQQQDAALQDPALEQSVNSAIDAAQAAIAGTAATPPAGGAPPDTAPPEPEQQRA